MTRQKLLELISAQKDELPELYPQLSVKREALKSAAKSLSSPLVKVILGPRRAGKSIFALQLLASEKYSYLNFDDETLLPYLKEYGTTELLSVLDEAYGKSDFMFFDEIQNLPDWELFINRLQRRGRRIVLTGSNAELLSHELGSHLTGRYEEIPIMPFSWREFKTARKDGTLSDYMECGGYPEVVLHLGKPQPYLDTLVGSVILKDIVGRYRIRQPSKLSELSQLMRAQFAQQFTISKLAKALSFSSKTTLEKYLSYLKDTYLVMELTRYSHKFKEQLKAPRKAYLVDTGYIKKSSLPFDCTSRKLENLIYLGLLRKMRGTEQSLYYYLTRKGHEVDFLLRDGHRVKSLYQVAYSIKGSDTLERECRALVEAGDELPSCTLHIILWDKADLRKKELRFGAKTIEILGAEDFLASAL